jgi:hypothetical protein
VAWECGNRHYRFPRPVGRVGKTVSSFFSGFPWTGISAPASVVTALRPQLSPQGILPFVFEFNRAGIAQCPVHACLVIPEQPGDGFIHGVTDRFKALAVEPFHLQRAASCLNSSVYRPRFPFLIVISLSLLKQLAKGYVLRGQGHPPRPLNRQTEFSIDSRHIIFLEGDSYAHLFSGLEKPFDCDQCPNASRRIPCAIPTYRDKS